MFAPERHAVAGAASPQIAPNGLHGRCSVFLKHHQPTHLVRQRRFRVAMLENLGASLVMFDPRKVLSLAWRSQRRWQRSIQRLFPVRDFRPVTEGIILLKPAVSLLKALD